MSTTTNTHVWQRRSAPQPDLPDAVDQTLLAATDPRWVLAIKTSEALQGTVLPPHAREKLLRTGEAIGLTVFDANLIIAIVQDQARRGLQPQSGIEQLAMVPGPADKSPAQHRRINTTVALIALLTAEAFLVWWWLF